MLTAITELLTLITVAILLTITLFLALTFIITLVSNTARRIKNIIHGKTPITEQ